jgi:hypothetical protein
MLWLVSSLVTTAAAQPSAAEPLGASTPSAPVDQRTPTSGSAEPAAPTPSPEVAAPAAPSAAPELVAPPLPPPAAPESVAPRPPPPFPLKFGANYFTRYELRSGDLPVIGNRPLNADTIFYRARVSLASLPLELGSGLSSSVYFEPQASGAYDVGGELTDVGLDLHQGFVSLMSIAFKLDVGRFEMAYGEHLVIGSVPWHQTGRAFNGARIHIARAPESVYLDIFATLLDDGKLDGATQRPGKSYVGSRDAYFVGAYAGLGPALGKLELDVYVLSKLWFGGPLTTVMMSDMGEMKTQTLDSDPALRATLGSRIKQDLGVVDYRVEAGVQLGALQAEAKTAKVFAYQADGELGLKAGSAFRIAAHGFIASGDDPKTRTNEAWDQLYPTAHKFLGLTDVFGGRSNVAGAALHLTAALTPNLKAAVDGHTFFRPEPPMGKKSYTGSEVDLGLAYAFAPSLSLRGLYGVFVPSKTGPFATDQLQHYVEVELAQVIK